MVPDLSFPSIPGEPSQPSRPADRAAGGTAFADVYAQAIQSANQELSQIATADPSTSASDEVADDPLSFLALRAASSSLSICSPLGPGDEDLSAMQGELMQLVAAIRIGQGRVTAPGSVGSLEPSLSSASTAAAPVTDPSSPNCIHRLISWLDSHAHLHSTHLCAASVRQAMEAAGIQTQDRPPSGDAGDYGPFLLRHGAQVVAQDSWEPKAGDIAVFDRTPDHPAGHIQVFDGQHWVSDFVQHSFSPYIDQQSTPPVTVFRLS